MATAIYELKHSKDFDKTSTNKRIKEDCENYLEKNAKLKTIKTFEGFSHIYLKFKEVPTYKEIERIGKSFGWKIITID